ncbi:hypothetical protein GOODEAATRI_014473 [Goodea atripinnis]|uniref:Uncharacterized protein n=1 Tax=Goodea atripinnis TaxID=208336 RepID=A0ABV0NAK9_9TELE
MCKKVKYLKTFLKNFENEINSDCLNGIGTGEFAPNHCVITRLSLPGKDFSSVLDRRLQLIGNLGSRRSRVTFVQAGEQKTNEPDLYPLRAAEKVNPSWRWCQSSWVS